MKKMIVPIAFLLGMLTATMASANEEDAVRAAFMNLKLGIADDGSGAAQGKISWRIVQAENSDAALKQTKYIAKGVVHGQSANILTNEQREAMYLAWHKSQQQLWTIIDGKPERIFLVKEDDGYRISSISPDDTEGAIREAFYHLSGFVLDGSNDGWRIARGDNEMDAISNHDIVMEGVIDLNGNAALSPNQRAIIYQAWKQDPEKLWLIYFGLTYHFVPKKIQGRYQITLVEQESKVARLERERSEKEALAAHTPLPAAVYTQQGFDPKPFIEDFDDWRARFKQDIDSFNVNMRNDRAYGRKLVTDKNPDALAQTFSQSIHTGIKGLALRSELISAYYAGGGSEGTEVTPSGSVLTDLILSTDAKPVGFGGTFTDEGNTVELWYMVFSDMSNWNQQQFNESLIYSAFSSAELPPYKVMKRNSWPALVFSRGTDGKVKLYGLSMEMARILRSVFNSQIQ